MDRLFLDANVLFSAAWRPDSLLQRLWKLKDAKLYSSRYAVEEARANLETDAQRERLGYLTTYMQLVDATAGRLPREISLPDKDTPILLAAVEAGATHLLTGDVRHFGRYFGRRIQGVLILQPGAYLRSRQV